MTPGAAEIGFALLHLHGGQRRYTTMLPTERDRFTLGLGQLYLETHMTDRARQLQLITQELYAEIPEAPAATTAIDNDTFRAFFQAIASIGVSGVPDDVVKNICDQFLVTGALSDRDKHRAAVFSACDIATQAVAKPELEKFFAREGVTTEQTRQWIEGSITMIRDQLNEKRPSIITFDELTLAVRCAMIQLAAPLFNKHSIPLPFETIDAWIATGPAAESK